MSWHSETFGAPKAPRGGDAQKIDEAASKHRAAMTRVVKAAKTLATERRATLDAIKDPQLKKSAAR